MMVTQMAGSFLTPLHPDPSPPPFPPVHPQVPPALMQRTLSNPTGSSSFKLLKEVQAAGGVMRTVVAMKNTVMKIAVHNRQQVGLGGGRIED